ncbi:MAG TPA: hypothetical protein VE219_06415 [Candidatus Sulfotelmatobacter sp.]|nr:hypothetical protein [Candidatus Sulfotelmatobacter sp.]
MSAALGALTPAQRVSAAWAPSNPLPGLGNGRIWSLAINVANSGIALAGTDNGVYRSADGGVSWTSAALSGTRIWAVGFDVRDAHSAYAATAGKGIAHSADDGQTWADSSSGLTNPDIRSLAFGLDGIAAGTADGVALSVDGAHWLGGGAGDPLHGVSISSVTIAANAPQFTVIAGADGGDLSRGYLFRTTPQGDWEPLHGGLPAGAVVLSAASGPVSQSVSRRPLLINTSRGTFRSSDGGSTWSQSQGIPNEPTALTLVTTTFSPLDPNLAYSGSDAAGSSGGELMRSTDGGASFAPASQGIPDRSRNVSTIAVGATTPPTLLAGINPPGGGSMVFRQLDATAPSPPNLVAEGGGPVPVRNATPAPTNRGGNATRTPPPTSNEPSGGFAGFLESAFHWPFPLVPEVLFVLLVGYTFIRWRQRYLDVEGPP